MWCEKLVKLYGNNNMFLYICTGKKYCLLLLLSLSLCSYLTLLHFHCDAMRCIGLSWSRAGPGPELKTKTGTGTYNNKIISIPTSHSNLLSRLPFVLLPFLPNQRNHRAEDGQPPNWLQLLLPLQRGGRGTLRLRIHSQLKQLLRLRLWLCPSPSSSSSSETTAGAAADSSSSSWGASAQGVWVFLLFLWQWQK